MNVEERWARVQPGVVLANAEPRAAPARPAVRRSTRRRANRATIGGGIGNNSCGSHSVDLRQDDRPGARASTSCSPTAPRRRSDRARGEALAAKLDGAGPRGRPLPRRARASRPSTATRSTRASRSIQRRVSGYNLDDFIAEGAHGPLADDRRLRGHARGRHRGARAARAASQRRRALAVLHFESVRAAAEAVLPILEHAPSTVELVDQRRSSSAAARASASPPLVALRAGRPRRLLVVEFYGDNDAEVRERLERIVADMRRRGIGYATHITTDPGEQLRIWRMREAGLGLLMSVKGDAKPIAFVEDTAVDPAKLRGLRRALRRDRARARHRGGLLRPRLGGLPAHPPAGEHQDAKTACARSRRSRPRSRTSCSSSAESLSGEHGDGILRGVFTERMFGAELTEAFREVKAPSTRRACSTPARSSTRPRFDDNLRLGPRTMNLDAADLPRLLRRRRDRARGRAVQRPGRLPQGRRRHVPLVHGDARRGALDARPREPAAPGAERRAPARATLTGRRASRGARPLRRVQGVQGGVPVGRRHGEAQVRGADDAPRGRTALPLRDRLFGHIATWSRIAMRARAARAAAQRRRRGSRRCGGCCSAALGVARAAAAARASRARPSAAGSPGARAARRGGAPRGDVVFFDDTFTRLLPPGGRAGGDARPRGARLPRRAGRRGSAAAAGR